ncbi:MAG: DUF507 family protein [Nitrospirae bacterium]|nr:DUF507 family protein [Nitrospirota bacterium]
MRIPKTWVKTMSKKIVLHLMDVDLIEPRASEETLISETEAIIMNELMVEDRLNEEVRELLKKHEAQIDRGRLDYKRLFELTKQKLVKERDIVL